MNSHLSEEQFSGLLLEQGEAETRAHLAGCADCRAELERVRDSLASFNAIGMEWAERRSATLGPVRISAAAGRRMPLVWATAMLVVSVLAGGLYMEQQRGVAVATNVAPVAPAVVAESPRQTELVRPVKVVSVRAENARIAEDNRLLAAIDRELSSGESLLVPVSELRTSGRKAQRRLND